jgi:hypothetical protein
MLKSWMSMDVQSLLQQNTCLSGNSLKADHMSFQVVPLFEVYKQACTELARVVL